MFCCHFYGNKISVRDQLSLGVGKTQKGVGRTSSSGCCWRDFWWGDDSGCSRVVLTVEWCLPRWFPPNLVQPGRWEETIPAWNCCLWLLLLCFSKHILRSYQAHRWYLWFFISKAGTAGFCCHRSFPWLGGWSRLWKLNQTRQQVIDPGPFGLCLLHPTNQELSQLQQPWIASLVLAQKKAKPGSCGGGGEGKWKNISNKQIHIPGKALPKNV